MSGRGVIVIIEKNIIFVKWGLITIEILFLIVQIIIIFINYYYSYFIYI